MARILGKDGKLYYQSSGTRAAWPGSGFAPNLQLINNVTDVNLNMEKEEGDVSTRGGGGFAQTIGTLKAGEVTFQMIWDSSDAAFTAMKNAFFNNTLIALAVLDQLKSTEGSQGLWADFEVINFSRAEPLRGVIRADVTVKVGFSLVEPEWVTVTAS